METLLAFMTESPILTFFLALICGAAIVYATRFLVESIAPSVQETRKMNEQAAKIEKETQYLNLLYQAEVDGKTSQEQREEIALSVFVSEDD